MFHHFLHRKAVKATLVLLPLLGITYMLFFVNPGEDDISQIVFIYFNSFLQSFQVRIMPIRSDINQENQHTLSVNAKSHNYHEVVVISLYPGVILLLSGWHFRLRLTCGKMIRSSILAVLIHNMAFLPHVQCSQLSGLTRPHRHDFCSVAFFLFISLSTVFKIEKLSGRQEENGISSTFFI